MTPVEIVNLTEIADTLPKAEDVLSGTVTQLPKMMTNENTYAFISVLSHALKDKIDKIKVDHKDYWKNTEEYKNWNKEVDNCINFFMLNVQPELVVTGVRTMFSTFLLPVKLTNLPGWKTFANKYKKFIIENL